MLRAAITFFLIGLSGFVLCQQDVACVSLKVGKILLLIFLILSALSFFEAITVGNSDYVR
jgi:uncharacterized membrane protein YtjA (UPF0391 family)